MKFTSSIVKTRVILAQTRDWTEKISRSWCWFFSFRTVWASRATYQPGPHIKMIAGVGKRPSIRAFKYFIAPVPLPGWNIQDFLICYIDHTPGAKKTVCSPRILHFHYTLPPQLNVKLHCSLAYIAPKVSQGSHSHLPFTGIYQHCPFQTHQVFEFYLPWLRQISKLFISHFKLKPWLVLFECLFLAKLFTASTEICAFSSSSLEPTAPFVELWYFT